MRQVALTQNTNARAVIPCLATGDTAKTVLNLAIGEKEGDMTTKINDTIKQVYELNQEIRELENQRNKLIHSCMDSTKISYQEFDRQYRFVYQQQVSS
jgi:predicted phage-related endonuclease